MPSVVGTMTKGAVFVKLVDRTDVITAPISKSGTYTATVSDDLILCDASGGGFTIDLYTAVGYSGKEVEIKKTDSSANTVTVDGNGAQTIDGATTKVIQYQYSSMRIISDGSNWSII